jgi:hypothetical protein
MPQLLLQDCLTLLEGSRLLIRDAGRRGTIVIDAALPLGARWLGSFLSVRQRPLRRRLLRKLRDNFLPIFAATTMPAAGLH